MPLRPKSPGHACIGKPAPDTAKAVSMVLLNFPLRILVERRLGPTFDDPFL